MTSIRIFTAVFFLVALTTLSKAEEQTQPTVLTPASAEWMYLYYSYLQTSPMTPLAAYQYKEYRDAKDEFKRNDILQRLAPEIELTLAHVRSQKTYVIRQSGRLSLYDFEGENFLLDTPINAMEFWETDEIEASAGFKLKVAFDGRSSFQRLWVNPQEARELASATHGANREVDVVAYFMPQSASERSSYGRVRRALHTEVVKIEIKHPVTDQLLYTCVPGMRLMPSCHIDPSLINPQS